MSEIGQINGGAAMSQLQRARLVEDSRAEEKTESRTQEAAETAAEQAKKAAAAPAPSSRGVDTYA
jgi:hypothetical protein